MAVQVCVLCQHCVHVVCGMCGGCVMSVKFLVLTSHTIPQPDVMTEFMAFAPSVPVMTFQELGRTNHVAAAGICGEPVDRKSVSLCLLNKMKTSLFSN